MGSLLSIATPRGREEDGSVRGGGGGEGWDGTGKRGREREGEDPEGKERERGPKAVSHASRWILRDTSYVKV